VVDTAEDDCDEIAADVIDLTDVGKADEWGLEEVGVAEGINVAMDGGNVVCFDVNTAHIPLITAH